MLSENGAVNGGNRTIWRRTFWPLRGDRGGTLSVPSIVSVCAAPFYVARSALINRRLAVIVANLRGCIGGVLQLIVSSIPPVMTSIGSRVMLCRCGDLHC